MAGGANSPSTPMAASPTALAGLDVQTQKERFISNLLQRMRREKLIAPQGARSRAIWVVTTDGGTSDRREGKGEES
jgi:hypothetical protein